MKYKVVKCPFCGNGAIITYEENKIYRLQCCKCNNLIDHIDKSWDNAVDFFNHFLKNRHTYSRWDIDEKHGCKWVCHECGKEPENNLALNYCAFCGAMMFGKYSRVKDKGKKV